MAKTKTQLGDKLGYEMAARRWSVNDLMIEVGARLPTSLRVSGETLRKYCRGDIPRRGANPILVAAMAAALRMDVDELVPGISGDLAVVAALVVAGAPLPTRGGDPSETRQPLLNKGCCDESAAIAA